MPLSTAYQTMMKNAVPLYWHYIIYFINYILPGNLCVIRLSIKVSILLTTCECHIRKKNWYTLLTQNVYTHCDIQCSYCDIQCSYCDIQCPYCDIQCGAHVKMGLKHVRLKPFF